MGGISAPPSAAAGLAPGPAESSPHDLRQLLVDFAASCLLKNARGLTPAQAQAADAWARKQVDRLELALTDRRALHDYDDPALLAPRINELSEEVTAAATALLHKGLEQRVGGFASSLDRSLIAALIRRGALAPHRSGAGLWVCRQCGWVWRPETKRITTREPTCHRCHRYPHAQARRFTFTEHVDGRGYTITYLSGKTEHSRMCAVCAGSFQARHAGQAICQEARCRKAAERRRKAGEPLADLEAGEVFARLEEERNVDLRPLIEQMLHEQISQFAQRRLALSEEQAPVWDEAALEYLGR